MVLTILYNFSAAVSEPLADKKIVNVLEQIGGTFKLLLAIMFCISTMLIIGIAIILKISSTGLMLRLNLRKGKYLFVVNFINSWAQKLIVVIVICTIIEMILPDGKNKKYIKMVMGLYVVFTIISPVISKLDRKINLNNFDFNLKQNQTIQTDAKIDTNKYVEDVYIDKLKTDIKSKLETKNYSAKDINIQIETQNEESYGTILSMQLSINKIDENDKTNNSIKINEVVIGEQKVEITDISKEEKEEVKKYLADMYDIDEDIIVIN